MGFSDFLSNALEALAKSVPHSPIVKSLSSLAGIVSQAVPIVGPIVNTAVPALDAIFSKDSSSPDSGEDLKALTFERLNTTDQGGLQLQRPEDKDNVQEAFNTMHSIENPNASMDKLQEDFGDKLIMTVGELQEVLAGHLYTRLSTVVRESVKWFENHQEILKVTAHDGRPDKFKPLLFDQGGQLPQQRERVRQCLGEIETAVLKKDSAPAQQMLDLYLLAVHWLLIYDKVSLIIVTRGIYIRSLQAGGQKWAQYLEALNSLSNDINELHHDATNTRDVLQTVLTEVPKGREQKVKLLSESGQQYIEDDWPVLAVGWVSPQDLHKQLALAGTTVKSHRALTVDNTNAHDVLRLWQEYAVQAVNISLQPARAVKDHLEECIQQWSTRVPVGPSRNLAHGEQHIKAHAVAAEENMEFGKSLFLEKENFAGKNLRYTLTYCGSYGESPSSAWSEQCYIDTDTRAAKLEIHPIEFDNSPLGAESTGELTSQRLIRRRVYVGYTEDHGERDVVLYLGEIDEHTKVIYHVMKE